MKWDRCLTCACALARNDKLVDTVVEVDDIKLSRLKWFLKYLLGEGQLLEDVLQMVSMSIVRFCGDCEVRAEKIMALQLELEMVQMRILNVVQTVKEVCQWAEKNEGFQKDLERFRRDLEGGGTAEDEDDGRLVKVVTEVQKRVSQKESLAVFTAYCHPKVAVEKYVPLKSETKDASGDTVNLTNCPVKQEPIMGTDEDEDYSETVEDSHLGDGDDNDDEDYILDEQQDLEVVPKLDVGRKRNSAPNSCPVSPKLLKSTESGATEEPSEDKPSRLGSKIVRRRRKAVRKKWTAKLNRNRARLNTSTIFNSKKERSPTEKLLLQLNATHSDVFKLIKSSTNLTCHLCGFSTDKSTVLDQHLREHENETDDKGYHCPKDNCNRSFAHVQSIMFHLQQHLTRKRKCTYESCTVRLPVLELEEHLKTHYERLFKCQSCDFSFGNYLDLINHNILHGGVSFSCLLCADTTDPEMASKLYVSRTELRQHLYNYHKMEETLLKCDYPDCPETFMEPMRKSEHLKLHKANLKCTICSKLFKTKALLKKHLAWPHKGELKSDFKLRTRSSLSSSQKKTVSLNQSKSNSGSHSETEKALLTLQTDVKLEKVFLAMKKYDDFTCLVCGFRANLALGLDQHLREHEKETERSKIFHCPDNNCGRSFAYQQHFVFHLQQHCTRNRVCLAKDCNVTLPVLQMEEHLKTHFDNLFSCEYCDFSFPHFLDLIYHCRYHVKTKIKCQLCPDWKRNSDCYERRREIREHLHKCHGMEEVLLKCEFPGCSETFLDPASLRRHANSHKKTNTCSICSKGFNSPSLLTKHIAKLHKNDEELLNKTKSLVKNRSQLVRKRKGVVTGKYSEVERMLVKLQAEKDSKLLFEGLRTEKFVCVMCNRKEVKASTFSQHLQEHEVEEEINFHCVKKDCTRKFTNKQAYAFHLQNHCSRRRKCETCEVMLPILEMNEHLKQHFEKVWICQLCDYSFGHFKDMLHHLIMHHQKADLICQLCPEPENADIRYPGKLLLLEHLYKHHKMEELLLKCGYPEGCPVTFLDPRRRTAHEFNVHGMTHFKGNAKQEKPKKKKLASKPKPKNLEPPVNPNNISSQVVSEAEKTLLALKADDSCVEIFQSLVRNQYSCVTCAKFATSRTSVMEQHLRGDEEKANQPKNYFCPEANCNRSFAFKQAYIFHLQQHCTIRQRCDYCEESLPVLQMEAHFKTHYEKIYYCQLCNYCFGNFKDFVVHGRYHQKADHTCPLCTEPEMASTVYSSFTELLRHFYEHHNKQEVLLHCSDSNCKETFIGRFEWKQHEKRHKPQVKCQVCGVVVSRIKIHMKRHTGQYNILCDQCPQGFKTTEVLLGHKIRVHGHPALKCHLCTDPVKEFETPSGLRNHILKYHEQIRWKCSICGKEVSSKTMLVAHEQTHSESTNFQCEVCGHATKSLMSMKRHKKIHGEKKYKCSYCPKAFTIKRYLNEHTLTHTKEQPFVCDLCGARFNQRYSLTMHKKKKHGYKGVGQRNLEELKDSDSE